MAGQTQKSMLYAKYGKQVDEAVKAAARDDADYGQIRLPGGIRSGVAQIVECGFFQYDQGTSAKKADGNSATGELYFRAAGTVIEPYEVQGIKVQGLQTSIMESVCATKNSKGEVITVAQHIKAIENHLRILGADTTGLSTALDLEGLAAMVKVARPYFRFSTSEGKATPQYPTPKVFENWHGSKGLEEYTPPGGEGEIVDNTTLPPTEASAPSANGSGAGAGEADAFEGDDLDALLSRAEGGDTQAGEKIKELALAAGMSDDDFGAAGWEDVILFIRSASEGGDEAPEPEAPAEPPKKGETVQVKLDPKSARKVDCEIISVDPKKQTVALKNLVTGKPVLGKDKKPMAVAWGDLS